MSRVVRRGWARASTGPCCPRRAMLRHRSISVVPTCASSPGGGSGTSIPGTTPPISTAWCEANPIARSTCAVSPRIRAVVVGSYWLTWLRSESNALLPEKSGGVFAPSLVKHVEVHPHFTRNRKWLVQTHPLRSESTRVPHEHDVRTSLSRIASE